MIQQGKGIEIIILLCVLVFW